MNVCFLPGSLCDRRVFGPQLLAASAAGHDCDVADLTADDSIEAMAARVIEQTNPGVVLVGLSLGAIVATEVVAQAPDHVAALALLNTNLSAPDERQLASRRAWASQVRSGEFARMVADNFADSLTRFPSRHNELIFDMAMACGGAGFHNQNEALLHRRDRAGDLAAFAKPVLIVASSDDHICPPAIHRTLARDVPTAQLEIIAEAGHLSSLDQPDAVATTVVEWLTFCTKQIQTQEGTHEHQHA